MTRILFYIVRIYRPRSKCSHLKNENFYQFFLPFPESPSHFRHLAIKDDFIATLFRKLQIVKELFRLLSKKLRFRTPFDSQHVNGS